MKFSLKEKLVLFVYFLQILIIFHSMFVVVELIQEEANNKQIWCEIAFSVLCFVNILWTRSLNKKTFKKLEGK